MRCRTAPGRVAEAATSLLTGPGRGRAPYPRGRTSKLSVAKAGPSLLTGPSPVTAPGGSGALSYSAREGRRAGHEPSYRARPRQSTLPALSYRDAERSQRGTEPSHRAQPRQSLLRRRDVLHGATPRRNPGLLPHTGRARTLGRAHVIFFGHCLSYLETLHRAGTRATASNALRSRMIHHRNFCFRFGSGRKNNYLQN